MKKILISFGTRPEVIKLSPVIKVLQDDFKIEVMHTGQHRELVSPMLALFEIEPDINLDIMEPGQDLFSITQKLMPSLKTALHSEKPDYVMVQGDTTTSYLTALAAFYLKIPVLHVEAGLRSHNPYYPFPEEINRKQISQLAYLHFAPTDLNKNNLLREGVYQNQIFVTGNTVIDALNLIRATINYENSKPEILSYISPLSKLIVLTAHRRENHGEPLLRIIESANQLVEENRDIELIFPVHPNPNVQKAIDQVNITSPRFHLTKPFDYLSFLHIIELASLILTDSGGIQEEASALGKPVLVLRNETERQELIEFGAAKLVGSDKATILKEAYEFLNNDKDISTSSVFGKGNSAEIIRDILINQL